MQTLSKKAAGRYIIKVTNSTQILYTFLFCALRGAENPSFFCTHYFIYTINIQNPKPLLRRVKEIPIKVYFGPQRITRS